MDNELFIIEPDGSQINCGAVRSVDRVVSQESIELPEGYGQVFPQYVAGLKSEEFSFSLYSSMEGHSCLQDRFLSGGVYRFKSVTPGRGGLEFSGTMTNLTLTPLSQSLVTVDLDIQVSGRVTREAIRDINKMTNFEILEFLHRRLELE